MDSTWRSSLDQVVLQLFRKFDASAGVCQMWRNLRSS